MEAIGVRFYLFEWFIIEGVTENETKRRKPNNSMLHYKNFRAKSPGLLVDKALDSPCLLVVCLDGLQLLLQVVDLSVVVVQDLAELASNL